MKTLHEIIELFVASRNFDKATLSRLEYWDEVFGTLPLDEITPDMTDDAVIRLVERGKLKTRVGHKQPTGQPLAGSTVNRYINQLGSLFKYAKKNRFLPRTFIAPTTGISREKETIDPDRYLRESEIERLITVAKHLDRHYKKMATLILAAFHTGLRVGNLMEIRWEHIDFDKRTIQVNKTKNGEPITSVMSERLAKELKKMPNKHPGNLVFGNRYNQPYTYRKMWNSICDEAGLSGRNFHQLRHGCGHKLAVSGVNQAMLMETLGHKTLTASKRYIHANIADRKAVIDGVF